MEKFMLLFEGPMPAPEAASPEAMQEIMGKWFAWIEKLSKDGRYVTGEPLLPGGKILKGSHKNVVDGPFTEGKEIIGGFFIINARDYEEAAALCEDFPDYATGGNVIIRQVQKVEMPA
ncbi:YciI family protein [Lacibacter sp. MH-610]|jgi:hypothetical protein|uniref:YciI family protein n=1 Tax=Lacibacter sp. MH-610 TaxID=3020883 RepID=UPI0038921B41